MSEKQPLAQLAGVLERRRSHLSTMAQAQAAIAELERTADDLQALCDKQALILGERDRQLEAIGAGGVSALMQAAPAGYRLQPLSEFDAYSDVLRQVRELECENLRLKNEAQAQPEAGPFAAAPAPDGYKLVPLEPTPEMMTTGRFLQAFCGAAEEQAWQRPIMAELKVAELDGLLLDGFVKKALMAEKMLIAGNNYSTNWMLAGSVIKRAGITVVHRSRLEVCPVVHATHEWMAAIGSSPWSHGPTPLIAAMRAFVRHKFGDVVVFDKVVG